MHKQQHMWGLCRGNGKKDKIIFLANNHYITTDNFFCLSWFCWLLQLCLHIPPHSCTPHMLPCTALGGVDHTWACTCCLHMNQGPVMHPFPFPQALPTHMGRGHCTTVLWNDPHFSFYFTLPSLTLFVMWLSWDHIMTQLFLWRLLFCHIYCSVTHCPGWLYCPCDAYCSCDSIVLFYYKY